MITHKEVIQIKTRAKLYGQEATELLRLVSIYPGLSELQLCRFYPGREDKIKNLLAHLQRQARIVQANTGRYFPAGTTNFSLDNGLNRAVWILLDFIDRVEYHSSGEFPVKITFFLSGEIYEIVHAAAGQEVLISHILRQHGPYDGRRIVLADSHEQLHQLDFPGISGFCTVDLSGRVHYYKKTNGGM